MYPKVGFTAETIINDGRTTRQSIDDVTEWLKTQDLPDLSDEQIALFLLSCDNEYELTKNTIKAYFSAKKFGPEVFNDRDLNRPDIQLQLRTLDYAAFPEQMDDGSVIIYHKLRDTSYSNYYIEPAMALLFMVLDSVYYDYPPKGLVILFDMKGVGLMHLTRTKIGAIRTFFHYLQEGLPLQLKDVHVLNSVYFIDKVMAIIRPFMKKELYNKVHFHPPSLKMEDLHKMIPKRCLPEEYGGDLAPIRVHHDKTVEKLKKMQRFFDEEEQQRKEAQKLKNDTY